jgi:hypothetical protein
MSIALAGNLFLREVTYITLQEVFGLRLSAGFSSKYGTNSITERSEPSAANR